MSSVVQCQLEVIRNRLQPEATAPGTRTTTIWCSRSRPGNHSLLLGLQREHSKTEYGVLRVSLDTMVHWLFGKILCTVCLVFFFYKYVWSSFCFLLHLKTKTKNLTALFKAQGWKHDRSTSVVCLFWGGILIKFFSQLWLLCDFLKQVNETMSQSFYLWKTNGPHPPRRVLLIWTVFFWHVCPNVRIKPSIIFPLCLRYVSLRQQTAGSDKAPLCVKLLLMCSVYRLTFVAFLQNSAPIILIIERQADGGR